MERKLRILHLEDLSSDAELISKALKKEKLDFDLLVVDTQDKFIDALIKFLPDIILADHSLPSFNSHDALAIVHEMGIKIPFILVTAAMSDEFAVDVIKKGADDYIIKDRLNRLPTAIHNSLEKFLREKERKVFLDELMQKEKRYRALVENSADAVVIINEEWKATYVSTAVERVLGYTEEETLQIDLFAILHPDDVEPIEEIMTRLLANPGVTMKGHTARMLHKNGSWRWIEATLTNLLHDPAIKGIVDNFRDVTERILAERKIIHLNRLYAFLSQINQIILHSPDEPTIFKEACRIACETGKFKAAWIGMFDVKCQTINFAEECGISAEDIVMFDDVFHDNDSPEHNILRTGNYYICDNVNNNSEKSTWKTFAAGKGYGSFIVLPLKKSGSVFGTFNLYAAEAAFFDSEEIELLTEATKDLSFALDVFEKEKMKMLADEKLKHKELRLNQAQAIAHLGSWELDFLSGVLTFSEEGLRILGLAPEDGNQSFESFISFIHPDDLEHVLRINKEAELTGSSSSCYHRIVKKDGTVRHVFSQAQFTVDALGNTTGMYGVMHDVTEMKEAEEELKESESNLHAIFENTSEGFILTDGYGLLKLFNNKAKEFVLLNTGKEISTRKSIYEFIDESRIENYKKLIAEVLTGKTISYDHPYERKGSGTKWFNFKITPVYMGGRIEGVCITAGDITERKQMEESLKRSEFRYRQIVETAQEGIWVVDKHNRTTFVNKKMCEIVGYSKEEMKGRPGYFLNDHAELSEAALQDFERRKSEKNEIRDSRLFTSSGRHIWADLSTNPIFDEAGVYQGSLAMITDITTRKEQELQIRKNMEERELLIKELTKSIKDLQQFTFITSHNFRAPLSNLIGLLSLVDFSDLNESNRKIVEMFKTSTNQLNKTINDLIQILIIRDNTNINITGNDIAALLQEVSVSLAYELSETKCTITTDFKVENVFFNRSYLESVLINLLANSIKYRSKARSLQVNISTGVDIMGDVFLKVEDNGLGIDLERNSDNIFGLYQRFHSNSDGEGLGLFMVKTQITSLGGTITVESEVDKGTTFCITFRQKRVDTLRLVTAESDAV